MYLTAIIETACVYVSMYICIYVKGAAGIEVRSGGHAVCKYCCIDKCDKSSIFVQNSSSKVDVEST
jgi:hypothetical protein